MTYSAAVSTLAPIAFFFSFNKTCITGSKRNNKKILRKLKFSLAIRHSFRAKHMSDRPVYHTVTTTLMTGNNMLEED